MSDFKNQLLGVLEEIQGSGSFLSMNSRPFLMPGMEIEGIGEIGFPVNPVITKALIGVAHKASFGKGAQTVLDTNVRSAWEIDANKIVFKNKDWSKFLESIMEQIKPDLGISEHSVAAHLYKLLVYEEGDFFLPHKDSEKEMGMFGTLIIGLPSIHTGGELIVKFDNKTEIVDFSGFTNEYKIPYAAFYADCEHEIKPITSGYRICLVYNLIQNKGTDSIKHHELGSYINRISDILQTCEDDEDIPKIVLLGHQYTPSSFTKETLKLNDRPKAEALLMAAEKAGFYAIMGLVTSYLSGELETDDSSYGSYNRRNYDDYGDDSYESGTMGEVYNKGITVEHWMQNDVPPLRNIEVSEDDLISPICLNDGEPIEQEAEGYTGNAGMEMQYWYHYGAVFLWPKKYHYDMIRNLTVANKLEWINYYNTNWASINAEEKQLIKRLTETFLDSNDRRGNLDYSPLAEWLINLNDEKYFAERGTLILEKNFKWISGASWVKISDSYPSHYFEKIFAVIGKMGEAEYTLHLFSILNQLLTNSDKFKAFIVNQTEKIPDYLNAFDLTNSETATAKNILEQVFSLSKFHQPNGGWLTNTTKAFTKTLNRKYVNDVLAKGVLESGQGISLALEIRTVCKEDLTRRVNCKPFPPADWSRPLSRIPHTNKHVWALLLNFLESPTVQIFDYKKGQAERTKMENAIINVTIDLRTETIRSGSPHTLRLIKTQAAYERELAKWEKDVLLLKKVEEI